MCRHQPAVEHADTWVDTCTKIHVRRCAVHAVLENETFNSSQNHSPLFVYCAGTHPGLVSELGMGDSILLCLTVGSLHSWVKTLFSQTWLCLVCSHPSSSGVMCTLFSHVMTAC